jgi:hypothetical protein
MANICFTSLSIQKDDSCKNGEFADNVQTEALRKEIEEQIDYGSGGCTFDYEDDNLIECSIGTRWNIPVDALREIAKRHDVKIRAVGREDGCGFVEVACITAAGDLLQHESIDFAF